MKLKFLMATLLFASSFCLSAQANNQEHFSKKECITFAKIYQHTLDNPFDLVSSMKKCVKALHISEKRMSEILQAQFAGNEIKLSSEEIKQLEKLKVLIAKDKELYDRKMVKFMTANKMQLAKFKEIKKAFQGDRRLQMAVNKLAAKN